MRISSKSHYALIAMVELALEHNRGNLQLKVISRRHNLSRKYLEQIFLLLRAKGLVNSRRGYRGGFVLARAPQEISVFDILEVMENSMSPVECIDHAETCDRHAYCAARRVWAHLKKCIQEELAFVTLAVLAEEQIRKGCLCTPALTYQI